MSRRSGANDVSGRGDLEHQQSRDRDQAQRMLAAHGSCQCTLTIDGVPTSTKPDGPRQDARGGRKRIHITIIPDGPDESRFPDCHYRGTVAEYS